MRIEQSFYGDYKVMDEMPFDLQSLNSAMVIIGKEHGEPVSDWPVTTDYDDKIGYWTAWFIKPLPDAEYEGGAGVGQQISHDIVKAFYEL